MNIRIATQQSAIELLHQMIGVDKEFRLGQWEAIEAVAVKKQRALVVQRTGWGKSSGVPPGNPASSGCWRRTDAADQPLTIFDAHPKRSSEIPPILFRSIHSN